VAAGAGAWPGGCARPGVVPRACSCQQGCRWWVEGWRQGARALEACGANRRVVCGSATTWGCAASCIRQLHPRHRQQLCWLEVGAGPVGQAWACGGCPPSPYQHSAGRGAANEGEGGLRRGGTPPPPGVCKERLGLWAQQMHGCLGRSR
jgi:hypothetical protein